MTINHSAPLAPGEIRTHTVGARTFTVMHVAGGSFTQASVTEPGKPSQVLLTSQWGYRVIDAYAQAIEDAEICRDEALEDDTQPMPAPVTPLEAIAVLRRWAEFQPDHTGILASALNAVERKIKESL